jgi:hypothetical protein
MFFGLFTSGDVFWDVPQISDQITPQIGTGTEHCPLLYNTVKNIALYYTTHDGSTLGTLAMHAGAASTACGELIGSARYAHWGGSTYMCVVSMVFAHGLRRLRRRMHTYRPRLRSAACASIRHAMLIMQMIHTITSDTAFAI